MLGYNASTKMVKLKLSEATLKQEMQKGKTFLMKIFPTILSYIPHLASKRANGRFTLMEELQEPLVDCQEMVCACPSVWCMSVSV